MSDEVVQFSLEQIQEAMEQYVGYCISCGSDRENCEPDTRQCKCEECGEFTVFGADEILFMGLVE